MATIIFSGRLTDDAVVNPETGSVTFSIAENVGQDQTNYFSCIGKFSEKQIEILKKGKYVEIVGTFNTKVNEKDGKKYYNSSTYVIKLTFPPLSKPDEGGQNGVG